MFLVCFEFFFSPSIRMYIHMISVQYIDGPTAAHLRAALF